MTFRQIMGYADAITRRKYQESTERALLAGVPAEDIPEYESLGLGELKNDLDEEWIEKRLAELTDSSDGISNRPFIRKM
jgi:hypothetical protein